MTKRPLNECRSCGKTWFPRGQNLSDECPGCKSPSVTFAPDPVGGSSGSSGSSGSAFPIVLIGCLLPLLALGALIVYGAIKGRQRDRETASAQENALTPAPKGEVPPAKPIREGPAIAPPPRAVPLNRPPTDFTSGWVRRGGIQTRVVGVRTTTPTLVDDGGRESVAREPALLVWVETQNVNASALTLRRWLNPLNEFATLTSGTARLAPAKFPPSLRVGGQLDGGHSLVPGGAGVVDVLAFEVPSPTARNLALTLSAGHVGEFGDFVHGIPHSEWSKK